MAIARRDLLVLGGFLGAGGLGMLAVRNMRPVGVEVGKTPVVRAVLAEERPLAGNPLGDVTLAVFTDYNCAACRRAHPAMMEAVTADGGVLVRHFDWPIFGEASRAAARAAVAADAQGLYPAVHAALMQGGRADETAAEAALKKAGGDPDLLRRTLADEGARIEGLLARNAFHAFSLGLGGTPGHLVGPVLVRGAVPARDFRRAIRRARELSR
ncbi:MAG: thioredoxin domain-containing protein [Sandarakinorhabdus sp.]|nr:thioredoxin domain-containing protein [Sandarakinorhabdus sp.]